MKESFELSDADYRKLAYLSNSDLSELYRWLTNTKFEASPKALWFGTVFHKTILEPKKCTASDYEQFTQEENDAIFDMYRAVFGNDELFQMLAYKYAGKVEVQRTWLDKESGISVKCKIDWTDNSNRHIVDFKTTKAKTSDEFQNECYTFEYNRQGAFYLGSHSKAEIFELIGVQKVAPYNIYRLPFHKSSDFIEKGRKRMRYLMQYAQQHLSKPDGWRPQSWQMIIPEQP